MTATEPAENPARGQREPARRRSAATPVGVGARGGAGDHAPGAGQGGDTALAGPSPDNEDTRPSIRDAQSHGRERPHGTAAASGARPPGQLPGADLANRLRRGDGGVSLIPYLMAGHPGLAATRDIGRRLLHSGIAALELGLPHSDPLADGPVIQRAGQRALDAGTTTEGCLEVAADLAAERAAPIVLMTYVNPVLAYGVRRFVRDAAEAGVAAVIIPDLPLEEAAGVDGALAERGVASVRLTAPTSTDERIAAACAAATGFVYTVTVAGITGSRGDLPEGVEQTLARVRARTRLPVAAGFGISRPEHLRRLRGHADAAIVGSSLVAEIDAGRDPHPMVKELLSSCR
ncbi:hypothetical protein GCM10009799_02550 [Nocardiopsis rhodophaea]|uniref:Tryptophan synthase alpha chain n=1 Tax=Nocardiopsis rhodophaea TaxID=280238 RepID=A0ABN2S5U1_9ACTN